MSINEKIQQCQSNNTEDQSISCSIEKNPVSKQISIKMRATKQSFDTNYITTPMNEINEEAGKENTFNIQPIEIDLSDIMQDNNADNKQKNATQTPQKHQKNNVGYQFKSNKMIRTHLIGSCSISSAYFLHAIYWQWIAMKLSSTHVYQFEHLQVSFALSLMNIIPAVSLWMDIYSPFISISVLIHSIWVIYHIFNNWIYNICISNPYGNMCDTVLLFKNISLGLLGVIIMHQLLLLLNSFHCKSPMQQKIDNALDKAANIDINSDDIEATEVITDNQNNQNNVNVSTPFYISDLEDELTDRFDWFHNKFQQNITKKVCKHCDWNIINVQQTQHQCKNHEFQLKHNLKVIVPKSSTNHAIKKY